MIVGIGGFEVKETEGPKIISNVFYFPFSFTVFLSLFHRLLISVCLFVHMSDCISDCITTIVIIMAK